MGNATAGYNTTLEETGAGLALSAEAMQVVTGTSNETWEVVDADKDVLDLSATHTIEASEDSGSSYATLGAAEFSLDYLAGRVTLDAYTSGSGVVANVTDVRISGKYLPRYVAASGRGLDYSRSREQLDSTTFGDAAMTREPSLKDVSATVDSLNFGLTALDGVADTEDTIDDIVASGRLLVLSIQFSSGGYIHRAFTKIASHDVSSTPDGLVEASAEFTGSEDEAAMASQTNSVWTKFKRGTA